MLCFRFNDLSYWFASPLFSHSVMARIVSTAARSAEVVWIESLMDCIETGMESEVKARLQEMIEDRHEIFSKNLAKEFQHPSLNWLAHAGLIDTQQPRLKAVWWVFYLDKQLVDKVKEVVSLPQLYSRPASASTSSYRELWADVKDTIAASDGEQYAWKGGDAWSGGGSWTGGDSCSGGWSPSHYGGCSSYR